jgi:hypothetical protein
MRRTSFVRLAPADKLAPVARHELEIGVGQDVKASRPDGGASRKASAKPLRTCAAGSPRACALAARRHRRRSRSVTRLAAVQSASAEPALAGLVGLFLQFGDRGLKLLALPRFRALGFLTGQADFPHPALGQDLTPSFACDAIGSF